MDIHRVVLTDTQDDFSSNARTDILEKYSRFHGKTEFSVWCNAPDVKYIDSFRDLIFQINPHHITCVYKKMFETAALNNLNFVDDYVYVNGERTAEHEYPGYFQEHVDKSNSCVYSTSASIKAHVATKGNIKMTDLNGWEICVRPHSEGNSLYRKPVANEAGDSNRRNGKDPNYRTLSPSVKSFPAMLRVTRGNRYANTFRNTSAGSSSSRGPSREPSESSNRSDTPVSHSSSSTGSLSNSKHKPIKIGRHFRHFRRNSSYIDQYREDYTYKRLNETRDLSNLPSYDAFISSCGSPACSPSVIANNSFQRWCPKQSHLDKSKVMPVCEKNPCITSGVPVPKRTPVLKTRPPPSAKKQPYVAQIPKLGDAPKKTPAVGNQRDGIPKLEFFATSLTVNNYNPIKTPPSPAHKSASNSASSLLMNCGRVTNSPVHMTSSFQHLLNQNLKGTE